MNESDHDGLFLPPRCDSSGPIGPLGPRRGDGACRHPPGARPGALPLSPSRVENLIAETDIAEETGFVDTLDTPRLAARFGADNEWLWLEDCLPVSTVTRFQARIPELQAAIHRGHVARYRKSGNLSRHALDERAPEIAALYRSEQFVSWLSALVGETLYCLPAGDAHAYAMVFHTRAGDHVSWHRHAAHYAGKRYTVLLGVLDDSAAGFEYEATEADAPAGSRASGQGRLRPGTLCLFNTDTMRYRLTPLAAGERRIVLAFDYVTDTRIGRWPRFVSDIRDSIGYFGFRDVFSRGQRG